MSDVSRRALLPALIGSAVATAAISHDEPSDDLQTRFDFSLAELRSIYNAMDPPCGGYCTRCTSIAYLECAIDALKRAANAY